MIDCTSASRPGRRVTGCVGRSAGADSEAVTERGLGAGPGPRSCPRSGPAREAGPDDLRRKRQQLLSLLLRHGQIYDGGGHWRLADRRWLAGQAFEHTAQQIVLQEKVDAIADAAQRPHRVDERLAAIVPTWSMAPVVEAYQAMRGVSFLVAVTFAAEIGDVRRFDTLPRLMAFIGLVPGERSTGDTVPAVAPDARQRSRARRALVEAAWTYVETHENWLEAHRYLNMDYLRELKKEALRKAA